MTLSSEQSTISTTTFAGVLLSVVKAKTNPCSMGVKFCGVDVNLIVLSFLR